MTDLVVDPEAGTGIKGGEIGLGVWSGAEDLPGEVEEVAVVIKDIAKRDHVVGRLLLENIHDQGLHL